ncbi:Helix-hairpin-helix domain-containing protein [Gordonia westfalica]|uniref:Helix-hairpin-helix domain-containing protein n=1 Tax=Gordonia westfalica TaxID=158898 RepID=A0A1H2HQR9_9ACTN|nr:Helix-hairpin-helix domain-containing protein [Gordonia westfalica]
MATLAVLEPDALRRALADSDTKALTSVPGIGKRVAERLCVELRDKVDRPAPETATGAVGAGGIREQVAEALVGLGFTAGPAEKAVIAVLADDPDADASTALRRSLAMLGKAS